MVLCSIAFLHFRIQGFDWGFYLFLLLLCWTLFKHLDQSSLRWKPSRAWSYSQHSGPKAQTWQSTHPSLVQDIVKYPPSHISKVKTLGDKLHCRKTWHNLTPWSNWNVANWWSSSLKLLFISKKGWKCGKSRKNRLNSTARTFHPTLLLDQTTLHHPQEEQKLKSKKVKWEIKMFPSGIIIPPTSGLSSGFGNIHKYKVGVSLRTFSHRF